MANPCKKIYANRKTPIAEQADQAIAFVLFV